MPPRTFLNISICTTLLAACTNTAPEGAKSQNRGKYVYTKECSKCHGPNGEGSGSAALGMGVSAPDLTGLQQRNDGYFPREFVRRFVMGQLEKDDPDSPMPDFSAIGLRHVYPNGGADGEVLETDFEELLDYLEAIQN